MNKTCILLLAVVLFALPVVTAAQEATPSRQPGPPPQQPWGQPPGQGPGGQQPPPPRDASFFQGQAMRALDEKASLLLDQGKTDAAIETFRQVTTMDVSKDSPMYEMKVRLVGRMAKAFADSGRKAEAVDTIQKLLAEVPTGTPAEAAAWLEAGAVYKRVGKPEEALKAFDKAIELSKKLAQTGWIPPAPPGGKAPGQGGRRRGGGGGKG